MGFLDGLLETSKEVDVGELEKQLEAVIVEGETVERVFKVIRDLFVFTDLRLIFIDKQGITGKKVTYHSIPYKSVYHFSTETAGRFDLDSELKIWVGGMKEPVSWQFRKGTDVVGVQRQLAAHVLRKR